MHSLAVVGLQDDLQSYYLPVRIIIGENAATN